MRASNEIIALNAPAQTSSASLVVWASLMYGASVHITVSSGSLNGTFNIQGSNELATGRFPEQFTPSNFATLGISSTSVIASISAGSSVMLPFFPTSYEYLRVNFTAGNGGNTLGLYTIRMKTLNG